MLRTAIPFGYFFVVLFLSVVFVAGVVTFVVGLLRRSTPGRWIGATLCASIVIIVTADTAYDSALELNPIIGNDSQIVGTWTDGGQTVVLKLDHTFVHQTTSSITHGTWERDDWNLYLNGGSHVGTMRFVQFRSVYRLLPHALGDPDAWDGDLGLWLARHE